jgi:DNA polymerase III subunit delta'
MFFSEVIGQDEVKNKLRSSVLGGRIPHAQLFFGPDGSGTLAMAIAYAQYVGCTGRTEEDSCGICPGCRKITKLMHPDLHFAFPVNTSKNIDKEPVSDDYIKEWREFVLSNPYFRSNQWYDYIGLENKQGLISKNESELIIRKLNLKSFESDYKFMIIWLPEKMNPTSANMLLKLIEEPPEKTVFLLVSEEPAQVLVTIASRTQPIKLSRIDNESLAEAISGRFELNNEQLQNTIRLANGNFIQALEAINSSAENEFNFEYFTSIMRMCYKRSYPEINTWVEEMSGIGREKLKNFFEYAIRLVRENFISNLKNQDIVYMTDKEAEFSQRFHPYINGRNVISIYNEISKASADIERNGYAKLVLFDFSLRIVKLIRQ